MPDRPRNRRDAGIEFAALRADIERVVLAVGESLITMDTRFGELRAPLGILADTAPGVIEATGGYARELTRSIRARDADLDARSADIERVRRGVEALNGRITVIARSLKMMKLVATNARIHLFALRPRHDRLESFADNARELLESSSGTLAHVEATVSRATADLALLTRRAFPDLRSEAAALLPGFAAQGCAAETFGGDHDNDSAIGRRLADHVDHLRADVEAVLVSLQSGDRASQRIEHAEAILRSAASVPGAGGLAALANAQLSGALADLAAETDRITASLGEGVARFEDIAGLGGAATVDERVRAFETLLGHVTRAQAGLDGLGERRAVLLETAEAVMDRMNDLREVLGGMSSLSEDLRLVGTNAVLASGELAEDGEALKEIAGQLRRLATESATDLTEVFRALVAGRDRISDLIADIRDGAARSIAKIEAQGVAAARGLDDVFQAGRLVTERMGDLVVTLRGTLPGACAAMRGAVARLDGTVRPVAAAEVPPLVPGPAVEAAQAGIWIGYSMDEERDIHRTFCRKHGLDIPEDTGPSGQPTDLDIFF